MSNSTDAQYYLNDLHVDLKKKFNDIMNNYMYIFILKYPYNH